MTNLNKQHVHKVLTYTIAAVWLVNGLFCKVLGLVPRHQEIVAQILGREYAKPITLCIGFAEILMAIWIISGWKSRLNAILQILIIVMMNILEFTIIPNLLLWGKMNIIFAVMFCALIFYNEFILSKKLKHSIP